MKNKKTALVLGAGASTDYGFPTAQKLIDEIWHSMLTMNTTTWFPQLQKCGFPDDRIVEFRETLRRADPLSVDDFLAIEKNEKYREIGKAMIALALIQHESIGSITRTPKNDGETKLYTFLWHHLGTNYDEFMRNTPFLTIITFNYDRSLEYYLYQSLSNQFGDEKEAIRAIKQLRIIHVYGTLCPPHFLDETNGRQFTDESNKEIIERCRSYMHLIYEKNPNSVNFDPAHSPFLESEYVCFLGFRYSTDNLRQLQLRYETIDKIKIKFYGTACGMSPNERTEIENSLPGITLGEPSEKCVEFLSRIPVL